VTTFQSIAFAMRRKKLKGANVVNMKMFSLTLFLCQNTEDLLVGFNSRYFVSGLF